MKIKKLTLDERIHLWISKWNAHLQDYQYPMTIAKLKGQKWAYKMETFLNAHGVPKFAF